MKSMLLQKIARALLLLPFFFVVARAEEDALTTAVFSKVSNGYVRKKLPDGSFRRERYAISNGGYIPGDTKDSSIEDVKFPVIAGVVGRYLAKQNYFLAPDAKSADLLIIIRWGTSIPFSGGIYRAGLDNLSSSMNMTASLKPSEPAARSIDGIQSDSATVSDAAKSAMEGDLMRMQMSNEARDHSNEYNANLLGYMGEINARNDISRFAGGGAFFDDLISDIESPRYYVIISAVDFRTATQEKKMKLLWTTRVSIQAQGSRFDEALTAMVMNASKHFGRDSGRLIRQFQYTPKVDLGEMKVLAVVPDSKDSKAKSDEK